jgi:hypothetical protein
MGDFASPDLGTSMLPGGAVAVPLSMAAALAVLALAGSS